MDLYHLRDSGYERLQASELPGLDDLDFAMFKRCILMAETNVPKTMMALRSIFGAIEDWNNKLQIFRRGAILDRLHPNIDSKLA